MLICQNAEGVHGHKKVGNLWTNCSWGISTAEWSIEYFFENDDPSVKNGWESLGLDHWFSIGGHPPSGTSINLHEDVSLLALYNIENLINKLAKQEICIARGTW